MDSKWFGLAAFTNDLAAFIDDRGVSGVQRAPAFNDIDYL